MRRLAFLSASIAVLLSVSAVLLAAEVRYRRSENEAVRHFQGLVCGLGLGAAVSPDWGFLSYDPRIDPVDETNLWPVPAGYSYAPERGLSVSAFQESFLLQGYRLVEKRRE